MKESIDEELKADFYNNPQIAALLKEYEGEVLDDRISSFVAARKLLDLYRKE